MGFSEKKNSIIKELIVNKKAKDKALTIAGTEKAAKENAVTSKTTINDNDNNDLKNALANLDASLATRESINSLLSDVELSCSNASELHSEAMGMVKIAHTTALKAVALAEMIDELNVHVNNEIKHNKVILNLLVKDSAKAVVDAKTAVTLAAKALVDSITAAGSVCHLNNSLNHTKSLLQSSLPIITRKSDGLDEMLEHLKDKAQKLYDQSLKDKKTAEAALREATNKFNDSTTEANTASAALSAANAAVGQVN